MNTKNLLKHPANGDVYKRQDFNRKDKNGNTRELHTELSKYAIDYSVEEDYRTHYTPKQNESVELVTCPYFTTSVYDLTENMTIPVLLYSQYPSTATNG